MATFSTITGKWNTPTGESPNQKASIMLTRQSVYQKRFKGDEYSAFASKKVGEFQERFGKETKERESVLKERLGRKEKVFTAKEKFKAGLGQQTGFSGFVAKKSYSIFGSRQQAEVSGFNVETIGLFEKGKEQTMKELKAAEENYYENVLVGYQEVPVYITSEGRVAQSPEQAKQVIKDVEYQQQQALDKAYKDWEATQTPEYQQAQWMSTGGSYVGEYGQGFSSNLSPNQMGLKNPFEEKKGIDLTEWNKKYQPPGLADFLTQNKKIIGEPVKIAGFDETDFGVIESRRQKIVEEAKVAYTKDFFTELSNAQKQMVLIEQPQEPVITEIPTKLNLNQILEKSYTSAMFAGRGTKAFVEQIIPTNLFSYSKPAITSIIGGLSFTGEYVKSFGGEIFRNVDITLKSEKQASILTPMFSRKAFSDFGKTEFTPQEVYQTSEFSYTTGRLATGFVPYFTPFAPAQAVLDISQARTIEEVAMPVLFVGGTTLALKTGLKALELGSLKVGKYAFEYPKLVSGAEYVYKGTSYVAPKVLQAYGGISLSQSLPYLYSSDKAISREAERQLFVSFGTGQFAGMGAEYTGNELNKMINPRIGYELITQGKSGLGKLSKKELAYFETVYSRAYKKELPGNVNLVFETKPYSVMNQETLLSLPKSKAKQIARITEQTMREYGVYVIGSSVVPTQIKGKVTKPFGDVDIALASKEFGLTLAKRLKPIFPKVRAFESSKQGVPKLYVNLGQKEFVNITLNLQMTKGQLTKFGEPFVSTKGAFIDLPKSKGVKVLNIREQLRAAVEGYYFGGRAKDLYKIQTIVEGTEGIAKAYSKYKSKNVLLDETAMFLPSKGKVSSEKVLGISMRKGKESYSPYTLYEVPKSVKYFIPSYAKYETYSVPKQEYYKTSYETYPATKYALNYKPNYPTTYPQEYAPKYETTYPSPYTPKYIKEYIPEYPTPYKPKYSPPYQPKYTPPKFPPYKPPYGTTYKPPYIPPYTPPTKTRLKQRDDFKTYVKKQEKYYLPKSKTKLYRPGNVSNVILPIKTDWLKAIKYYAKKPKVSTIKLLPSKTKGFKQISKLLGVGF